MQKKCLKLDESNVIIRSIEMRHILVVDIETMRGENAELAIEPFADSLKTRAKVDLVKAAQQLEEKKENIRGKVLLTPVASKVMCIGIIEIVIDGYTFDETTQSGGPLPIKQTEHFIIEEESVMINQLIKLIKPQTEFVTFNGRQFDFPFLMWRAAVNYIPLCLPTGPYNGKNDRHYDMKLHLEQMSNLASIDGSMNWISLKKWIAYFNLPYQKTGREFLDIQTYYQNKEFDKIQSYCMDDVRATRDLFMKFIGNFQEPYERR